MAAMTTGNVYYSYPDASGNVHTVTLTYDATVQDSQGNVVGGWVGTETLPLGSSFKQQTKRTVGGETNVGVFSGTLWAVNDAQTRSADYTMATQGFEALGLRVKEQVAPTVSVIAPTSNQKFGTATPTFSMRVKDVGALSALATTEGAGDSGINTNSLSITLDGTTYTGASLASAFTITNDSGASGDGVIYYATPKTPLATSGSASNHSVSMSLSDNDGNTTTTATIAFVCDSTAPVLSVTNPSSTSSITNLTTYHITGTTTDDEASPVAIVVTVNGTDYQGTVSGGNFDVTVQLAPGASNSVTVTATNSAGLVTTWTGTIVQNNTVPVFDWVRVEDNPTTAGSVITITAYVSNSTPT